MNLSKEFFANLATQPVRHARKVLKKINAQAVAAPNPSIKLILRLTTIMICMILVSKTQQASAKLAPEEWKTITGSADLAQLDALNALMDSAKFVIKAMRWMLMVCAQ